MLSISDSTWTTELIPKIDSAKVAEIIARVSDLAIILAPDGCITSVLAGPNLETIAGIRYWKGQSFKETLSSESASKFEARLVQFTNDPEGVRPVQLNHVSVEGVGALPMQYSFHSLEKDGAILLTGSDLRSLTEVQHQLIQAQLAQASDYEERREQDIRIHVLLESSIEPLVFVSAKTGEIAAVNSAAESLFGKSKENLTNTSFAQEFEPTGNSEIIDQLVSAASEQPAAPVAMKAADSSQKLVLLPTLFWGANGQMLLCKINTDAQGKTPIEQFQMPAASLYENCVDAIAFLDAAGDILSANQSFLTLADLQPLHTIQGQPMADFLGRGSVDLHAILETTRRSGSMRLFSTTITSALGVDRRVEISTTQLQVGTETIYAMVLREVRRAQTVHNPAQPITDADNSAVLDLIGENSLKDIVAKTTDVIEKMCIEAAVKMASNNRVAVADMLGLSRQSLYVKLRKYDLMYNKYGT